MRPQNLVTLDSVKNYYGSVLQKSSDLKTNACCCDDDMPAHHKKVLNLLHNETVSRFYGCGSPIPEALEGRTVLDLGCGSGRDVYLCSSLVGPEGRVIGVDMTDEQLAVAERHVEYHRDAFGHKESNVTFKKGQIEDLAALDIADASVDVVISNCVINLSPDKERVFAEILRVLKPGGELYFSDVFSMRRVPEELLGDPVLHGECLSGAIYIEDFRRMMRRFGVNDHRQVAASPITINNRAIEEKIGPIQFRSHTLRVFKLESLEDRREDYGQVAVYQGGIPGSPHSFALDAQHTFEKGRPQRVCGNTAAMLSETRLAPYFQVTGDRSTHFGLFENSPQPVDTTTPSCC